MGAQTLNTSLVALAFSQEASYTAPVVGDKVQISDDYEVEPVADDGYAIGEVAAIETVADNKAAQVTVELRTAKVDRITASGAVTAGDLITSAGAQTGRTYVGGTDDPTTVYAVALEGAIDTADFDAAVI